MTQGQGPGAAVLAKTAIATLILLGGGCAERRPPVASAALPRTNRGPSSAKPDYITREVRHELVMLPYYGVFDNLSYRVDGDTVTLLGQVTRPTLKSDAEKAVKGVEGVERVVNEIEVLPLSGADDQIRLAVYRSIYGFEGLNRYGLQAVPPIHIIVKMAMSHWKESCRMTLIVIWRTSVRTLFQMYSPLRIGCAWNRDA